MASKALETYLNDHLAGSRLGADLAAQIRDRAGGTDLHPAMAKLTAEIEEDRQALTEVMDRVGAAQNQVKQATAWVSEKASRLKLSELGGLIGGDEDYGMYISLETLELGVNGKLCLWQTLKQQAAEHDGLDPIELEALADRARSQIAVLDRERLAAATRAFAAD